MGCPRFILLDALGILHTSKLTTALPGMLSMTSHTQSVKKRTTKCLLMLAALQLMPASASAESMPTVPVTSPSIQYEGRDGLGFLTSKDDDGYDRYIDHKLSLELTGEFPGIQAVLAKSVLSYTSPPVTAEIRAKQQQLTKLFLQVLSKAESAPTDSKPILLLASVRLAARLNNADITDPAWESARAILERYGIVFKNGPTRRSIDYEKILHSLWQDYPDTTWGKDAFLLDLKNAFNCAQGNQELHTMIRLGEQYIRAHPDDPRNPWINFVVAVAFEDWFGIAEFSYENNDTYLSSDDINTGLSAQTQKSAALHFVQTAIGARGTPLAMQAAQQVKAIGVREPPARIYYTCATPLKD